MSNTAPRKPAARTSRRAPPQSPPAHEATARVFWSGRSQAVRLPKAFRLHTPVVIIHREGNRIILEPLATPVDEYGWPKGFWSNLGTVDDDFDLGDRNQAYERPDPLKGD